MSDSELAQIDALITRRVAEAQRFADREKMLTTQEAAIFYRCHRHTIERLGKEGTLKRHKLPGGTRLYYKQGELEDARPQLVREDGLLKGAKRRSNSKAKN